MLAPFYHVQFGADLEHWLKHDPNVGRRVVRLVESVLRNPARGVGRPKRLADLDGLWSRRITREHRLFYEVAGETAEFIQCRGHDLPQAFYDERRSGP